MLHPTWLAKPEVFKELNGYRNIFSCEDYDFYYEHLFMDLDLQIIQKFYINADYLLIVFLEVMQENRN